MPWSASPKKVPGARNVIHRRNVHVLGVQGDFWPSRENRKVEFLVLHLKISIDIQELSKIYIYIYLQIYVLLIYGWILDHWNWCTSRLRNIQWSKSYEHIRDLQTPARSLFTGILSPKLGNSSLFIPKHSPLFCDWAILLFCDTKQKSALDNYDERVDPMYNCGVFWLPWSFTT